MKYQLYRCNHCGTVKALTAEDITDRVHTQQRGFDCDTLKRQSMSTFIKCTGTLENITRDILG